ncbi:methyltransferase, partial [bacterium]|nr:methyltransferase [bacterium]
MDISYKVISFTVERCVLLAPLVNSNYSICPPFGLFTVYGFFTVNSEAKSRAGKQLINIVDLGTGCGNIAATLARYIPHSKIYATDISKKALGVAKENARRHRVEDRITFL